MIYTRTGIAVTITRPITTTAEVQLLDKRSTDLHDVSRLNYGCYAAGIIEGSTVERLIDLGTLRADGGISEINAAARAVGCEPR